MANPNSYTTTDLISLIKLLAHVPQGNATFTPANILTLADFEQRTSIAKLLKEADEGYFQTFVEYDQDDSGIYPVPSNAIASSTYSMQIRNGQAIWPVSKQEVAEMTTTTFPSTGNWTFYIQENSIYMLPVQFSGVLRVTYEKRLAKLVPVSSCAQVSSIVGQVVTVTSVPSSFANGDTIDMQAAQPQFDMLGSREITDITGTNITLDGDVTDLSEGDFLCPLQQSCVVQLPVEFQQLLAQRVVCKIYELQGYFDKMKAAEAKRDEMEKALIAMITPRTHSAPKVINPSWGGRAPGNNWARFNPPAGRSDS